MIDIVLDDVLPDGTRRRRLASDQVIDPALIEFCPPLPQHAGLNMRAWSDPVLNLHYAEWTWPCMGFVDFHFEGMEKFRRLVVWKMLPGERVSEVIPRMAEWYFTQTKHRPQFAFIKQLPKAVDNGIEVEGCTLLEVDWALIGCVMVGG